MRHSERAKAPTRRSGGTAATEAGEAAPASGRRQGGAAPGAAAALPARARDEAPAGGVRARGDRRGARQARRGCGSWTTALWRAAFVETVARRKGWGRMRVAQELARRGAPEAAAQAALAGLSADADLEGAREAARRWRSRGAGSSADAAAALARHLSRRGFASSAIFKVLKEMASSLPGDASAAGAGDTGDAGESAPED